MKSLAVAVLFLAATAARADDAAALFQAKCKICHGPDGKGTPVGQEDGREGPHRRQALRGRRGQGHRQTARAR